METEQNTGRRSPGDFKFVKIDCQTFKWFKNGIRVNSSITNWRTSEMPINALKNSH